MLSPIRDRRDMATTPWFIRARLRTRHLMLLVAIAEEGNIHKAAQKMNMSQPAASRLLSDLEDIIGAELFDRLHRGVSANLYGVAVIRHARNALASLSEAASEVELLKSGKAGQVIVGAIEGPAMGFVPRAIAQVVRRHPTIRVQLLVQASDPLLDALEHGKLDLLVGSLRRSGDNENFEYGCLADEPSCAVVRPYHPLLQRHDLDLHDLSDLPWIVPPVGSDNRHRFDLMFLNEGIACPRQVTEAVSTLVITRLVEETDHLAVLPRDVAEYYAEREQLSILPVRLACKMDSCGIITCKNRPLSPSARLVRDAFAIAAADVIPKSAGERKPRGREPEPAEQPFATRVWKNLQDSEPLS